MEIAAGPWAVCSDPPNPHWHKGSTIFSPEEGRRVADVCILDSRYQDHARLIAEAPNLLKALEAACGYLINAKIDLQTGATKATAIKTIDGGLKMAHAAIAKATGETL
jgi:hypothetical protein